MSEVNNKPNISTMWVTDSERKALIIDVRSGSGVNFLSNTVNATKILDDDKQYYDNRNVSSVPKNFMGCPIKVGK